MTKPNNNQHDNLSNITTDITIVGGGMVGMAAAIALSQLNLSITLIENVSVTEGFHPSYDDRTLVVNRASIKFWQNIGIWSELSEDITPVNKVQVSNKGHFGSVQFDAKEFNLDALAYIVEAKRLGLTLKNKIDKIDKITSICPANVIDFTTIDNKVTTSYLLNGTEKQISSTLMLAADGIQSKIRKKLDLETQVKSYDRTAIICNITPELKHKNCAFERLTKQGPTALLPFVSNRCGFVWTVANNRADDILELSDEAFLKQAQQQFGYRLGKFVKAGIRSSYPLYLVTVPKQTKSRVILIGNAAHGMSPISAQGLNLAVRDVANLFDVINQAQKHNEDIGSDSVLQSYQQSVELDQKQTMNYTDGLMGWFKIDNPIVAGVRSLVLMALEQNKTAKFELFTRASGYRGLTPKLLRENSIDRGSM